MLPCRALPHTRASPQTRPSSFIPVCRTRTLLARSGPAASARPSPRASLSSSSSFRPRNALAVLPRRTYSKSVIPGGGSEPVPQGGGPSTGVLGHLESEVQIQSSERGMNIFPYRVLGHETQVAEIDLLPDEVIRAEVGSLLYMTQGVEMETKAEGFQQGFKRVLSGESFFITDFRNTNTSGVAHVAFGGNYPSKVLPLRLDQHAGQLICQKGAFLAGARNTAIELYFTQKLTTGFFGGEGFILQRLVGDGLVLLKGGGATIVKTLAPGEVLRVATGSIIAFEGSMHYDIQMIKGAKNILFGGEGLFFTQLTGPGKVWLQGLPFDRVVDSVLRQVQPGGGYAGLLGTAAILHGMGGAGGAAGAAAAGAAGGAGAEAAGAAAGGAPPPAKEEETGEDEDDDGDGDGDDGEGGGGLGGILGSIFGSND